MKLVVAIVALTASLPALAASPVVPGIDSSREIHRGSDMARGVLAKAAWCTKAAVSAQDEALPAECAISMGTGAFGVSADGHTLLVWGAETTSTCGEGDTAWSVRRRPIDNGKLLDGEVVARSAPCPADGDAARCRATQDRELVKALAKLAAGGWRDLPDLTRGTLEAPGGIQSHFPAAVLGAPLDGWMLYLMAEASGAKVLLVAPDNRRSIALETLDYGKGSGGRGQDSGVSPSWERYGSIRAASLTADQSALILSVGFHDGGHCSPSRERVERLWLPRKARALLDGATVTPLPR